METSIVTRVNNVEILATRDDQYVPIRPICQAFGIDLASQKKRIERDEILSSVVVMVTATGNDGKNYEMFSIPYTYVFGWLFSIDDSRVSEEARPLVIQYKNECYLALFNHFTSAKRFLKEKQDSIALASEDLKTCQEEFNIAKQKMNEAKNRYNKAINYTMEEWEENNRQLKLFPEEPEA